ncbi:ATP-dependent zinc metalloprotease FtsH [Desulfurivibrio dismutans]|uniref:ATP-dependent zinc metalloprotease FtsH n=1 Tax=Desulfurivibrio dismutans TaxID=1398908 RepID=UPI0023DC1503|nr:ATP-dependent zinc metalloprotease FtsH [Desulfurivibrio alkaliphilus]MDF1615556.1 ATP-dependent zinc metalloprotease FtsH [Desulfurivibrio alkaliphilus]
MNLFYKNLSMWLIIGLTLIMLFNLFSQPQPEISEMSYSDFLTSVEAGAVSEVLIQGHKIKAKGPEGRTFNVVIPEDAEMIPLLRRQGVNIKVEEEAETPWYLTMLISWFPFLLLIGVWIFFMRQMQMGGGKAMSFGKSKARLLDQQTSKVTFEDVAGIDEAKEELEEIIDFLKDPSKFTRLGGRIPKGVLLMGSPGTGKTLLAKAIAGEAGVPFFSISGSDFVEMFVGVGASRVRDLFVQGKKNAPCIIFIDEIDAVGRHRGAGLGGGHDEREQTLNQLLVEMDGFEANEGVIIVAATNRPDVLDPALLRPGRFDRQVTVPPPDVRGREQILKVHAKKTQMDTNVDWVRIARGTPGFSGADLENMVNEAALLAARENAEIITEKHLEQAKDKVMMGSERRSMIITEEEKKITAYHEAGHALVAKLLPGTDPLHKVTIIPRGRALGLTQQLPLEEKYTYPRSYLLNNLCILLGGRTAEELVFNEITTGAGNDIERATAMARKMVCEWGMSDAMGPLTFGKKEEQIFLGREISQHRDYSESTAIQIDNEVRRMIMESKDKVRDLLEENLTILHRVAEELLDKETLMLEDIERIIREERGEAPPSAPSSPQAEESPETDGTGAANNVSPTSATASDSASEPQPDSSGKNEPPQ